MKVESQPKSTKHRGGAFTKKHLIKTNATTDTSTLSSSAKGAKGKSANDSAAASKSTTSKKSKVRPKSKSKGPAKAAKPAKPKSKSTGIDFFFTNAPATAASPPHLATGAPATASAPLPAAPAAGSNGSSNGSAPAATGGNSAPETEDDDDDDTRSPLRQDITISSIDYIMQRVQSADVSPVGTLHHVQNFRANAAVARDTLQQDGLGATNLVTRDIRNATGGGVTRVPCDMNNDIENATWEDILVEPTANSKISGGRTGMTRLHSIMGVPGKYIRVDTNGTNAARLRPKENDAPIIQMTRNLLGQNNFKAKLFKPPNKYGDRVFRGKEALFAALVEGHDEYVAQKGPIPEATSLHQVESVSHNEERVAYQRFDWDVFVSISI